MNSNKLLCYLSKEARMVYDKLIAAGMDAELAFTMVESLGGEEVYCLDDDGGIAMEGPSNGQTIS